VIASLVFEPQDQNALVILVLVVLSWWFLCHGHGAFDEMCVRQFV
jgi:hypothetical protein